VATTSRTPAAARSRRRLPGGGGSIADGEFFIFDGSGDGMTFGRRL
jgi:hypothetical protein